MRFQVLGVNDDKNFCECCGKQGLKKVVWIEDTENGDIRHFGTTCALSPKHAFGLNEKEIKRQVSIFKGMEKSAWHSAHIEYKRKGGVYGGNARDGWKAVDQELLNNIFYQKRDELRKIHGK